MNNSKNKDLTEKDFFNIFFKVLDDCFYIYLHSETENGEIKFEIKNIDLNKYKDKINPYNEDYFKNINEVKKKEFIYSLKNKMHKDIKNLIDELKLEYLKKTSFNKNTQIISISFSNPTNPNYLFFFRKYYLLKKLEIYILNLLKYIKIYDKESEILISTFINENMKIYLEIIRDNRIIDSNDYYKKINEIIDSFLKDEILYEFAELAIRSREILNNLIIQGTLVQNNLFNSKENIIIFQLYKIEIKQCNDILEYQKLINELSIQVREESKDTKYRPKTVYYRGMNLNFDLSASLYRNKKDPKIEHIVNNRIIQSMPNDFKECDTFFDKLTIMKHFNCPSRLIDITKNPLIAAFFSLDNYYNSNTANYGIIYGCFPKSYDDIKNSKNSDLVSTLSALSTTNKSLVNDSRSLIKKIEDFLNYLNSKMENKEIITEKILKEFKEKLNDFSLVIQELISYKFNENIQSQLNCILIEIESIIKTKDKEFINQNFGMTFFTLHLNISFLLPDLKNTNTFNKEIRHQMELFNPSYKDESFSVPINVDKFCIVHPSLNNKRIVNQQGCFILVGASPDKNKKYYQSNTRYLNTFKLKKKRYAIIINNKDYSFYNNLNKIHGINKGFIYPELERKIIQIKDDIYDEYENYEEIK